VPGCTAATLDDDGATVDDSEALPSSDKAIDAAWTSFTAGASAAMLPFVGDTNDGKG
jgi:hypothetical protein